MESTCRHNIDRRLRILLAFFCNFSTIERTNVYDITFLELTTVWNSMTDSLVY